MSTSTRPAPAPAASRAPARWREVEQRHLVVGSAVVLVLVQTGWRAWASAGSWWYADDLELLDEARRRGLSPVELVAPHDSQLMPLGRLLAWSASRADELAWWPGALQLVLLQLAAGLAAVWMLTRVFGPRPAVLGPLALYLFSPLTLTAYMWWAAGINQLPMHLAFFLAVGCHATYARTGRLRWSLLAAGAVALGLTAYVKAVLILPVLLLLSIGPLARGGPRERARAVLGQWRGWATHGALGSLYVVVYTTGVPSPVSSGGDIDWTGLFRTMVVESLGSGLIGGPWRWSDLVDPARLADPPAPGVVLGWLIVGSVVAAGVVRSRRDHPRTAPVSALVLAVGWVGVAYVLAALGRAPVFGAFIGMELRYLADSVMVLALAAGLLFIPVATAGADRPLHPRTDRPSPARLAVLGPVLALAVGSVGWSSTSYVRSWHEQYDVRSFVASAKASAGQRPRTVADVPVPEDVMIAVRSPTNLPSHLLSGLVRLRAVDVGTDLEVLDVGGEAAPAAVRADATSPPGPREGCGYLVRDTEVEVPVTGDVSYEWWAAVSYLADSDTTTTLTTGATARRVDLLAGAHTLFVRGSGAYGPVVLQGVEGASVCVDAVRVGELVPLEVTS